MPDLRPLLALALIACADRPTPVLAPLSQGAALSVATRLDTVACSAAVTCNADPKPTVRLNLSCRSAAPLALLRAPLTLTCDGRETRLDPALPEGQAYTRAHPDPDPDDAVTQFTTYRGLTTSTCPAGTCESRYWNVALTLADARHCHLRTAMSAEHARTDRRPLIEVDLPVTDATGLVCSRHALDAPGSGLVTRYVEDLPEMRRHDALPLAPGP
jgi:hypothetical protein